GVVSREQYDEAESNTESLKATVEADRAAIHSAEESIKVDTAAVDSAKVELSYCYIRSPIDGRAGQRLVDIGNVVNPGGSSGGGASNNPPSGSSGSSNSLLVIERIDPIYADFTIPQDNLAVVQQQMRQGTLKTEVRLPDATDPTAGQRQVALGQRQGDLVVVEKGVEPGERVVTNGQIGVTPGGKVRVEQLSQAGTGNGAK